MKYRESTSTLQTSVSQSSTFGPFTSDPGVMLIINADAQAPPTIPTQYLGAHSETYIFNWFSQDSCSCTQSDQHPHPVLSLRFGARPSWEQGCLPGLS